MYRRILVPLDGSAFAEAALPLALELSARTGADLRLVTVLEPVTSYAYEGWEGAALDWTQRYLEDVLERIDGDADGEVDHVVRNGHTVDTLQKEAEEWGADVVVMASHGRGALSRLWLGSVADGFIRQADLPLLVVRPEDKAERVDDFSHSFRTILVPLDGSELSETALEHAIAFGELFGATYHLTRVVSYPVDLASPYLPHTTQMNQEVVEDAKRSAAKYLQGQAAALRERNLDVTTSVVTDPQPGRGVIAEVDEVDADMVAMATHGRRGLSRVMLGSTADKVLRGLHKPLLLFRPAGEDEATQDQET
ncbi:MAG: universal stress protein [Gemmatimonadetes bacterium]|nr:universal stress protein [Gemmatimonadota bacterium]NNL29782.1 universal stress protein [Gemmatimonadota bacterium]